MFAILAATCLLTQPIDDLQQAFQNPPASAKPHTWWHWMDGNITKGGITADLEAMKAAGIGGAHIFDVGQGVPSGPVQYNTDQWRDLFAHAIAEAKRLGLEMTVHNCAGWSSSGGPWVKPEDAMKKVVWSTVEVDMPNGGTYSGKIPQPPTVRNFYRDIQTYVFPMPQPASNPRNEKPLPLAEVTGLGANPGQFEAFYWPRIKREEIVALPKGDLSSDGTLQTTFRPGKWVVLRMGYTLTGAQNVASRDSGRGLEVDKLDAGALKRFFEGGPKKYLDRVAPLLKGPNKPLTTVLIDSYETGYNNWSGEGTQIPGFKYDTTLYLPALAGFTVDDSMTTRRFLYDFRQNLAERWTKNYSQAFADLIKPYGLRLAIEPYGNGNFDPFSFAKPAGLIMGEYWVGDSQLNPSVKHASSVAHVLGHNVVGAEALTAVPQQAGWRNQPRQWKPFADRAMTSGINRIIYHRFAHQPWVSGVLPGMTMGPWGSHVDRTNTFWSYMPVWDKYLARSQMMLQRGTFSADVLMFTGEDAPQSYAGEGQNLMQVPAGYDFDYLGVDPFMTLKVRDGRLVLPNGASYALLVMPLVQHMSPRVLYKLKDLVMAGAKVHARWKPAYIPGLKDMNQEGEFNSLTRLLWGAYGRSKMNVGKGTVYGTETLKEAFADMKLVPDFSTDARDVRAIHRRVGSRDVYFVASSQAYPRTAVCRFRVKATRVQLWDAETGSVRNAPVWRQDGDVIEVPLSLDADGSIFVVFDRSVMQPHLTDVKVTLPSPSGKPRPQLKITSAVYGDFPSGKVRDVTAIVREAADPYSVRIGATNNELGGDPAELIVKTLRVSYEIGGVKKQVELRENETLALGDLPEMGTPPSHRLLSTNELEVWQDSNVTVFGKTVPKVFSFQKMAKPVAVRGPWKLSFPAGWDAPASVTMSNLGSWTEHANAGVKYFSGTVKYQNRFLVPASLLGRNRRLYLDLGDVRELCRVRINGRAVATLWKPPFRVDVTNAVQSGLNSLEVDVTNLWTNRLIGDEQYPDDMGWNGAQLKGWPTWFVNRQPRPEPRRKTFTTWRHNFKDTPLLPSGLLGPVVLRPTVVVPIDK